jgi:hypothetical protein
MSRSCPKTYTVTVLPAIPGYLFSHHGIRLRVTDLIIMTVQYTFRLLDPVNAPYSFGTRIAFADQSGYL